MLSIKTPASNSAEILLIAIPLLFVELSSTGCAPAQNAAGAISSLANGVVDNLFVADGAKPNDEFDSPRQSMESASSDSRRSKKRKQNSKPRTDGFEDPQIDRKPEESISGSERPNDL